MSARINNIRLAAERKIVHSFKPAKQAPQKLPRYLKHYPNMRFTKGTLINFYYEMKKKPDFSNFASLPLKIDIQKRRMPTHIKPALPPQHDFMNFKEMSGNEILLNMTNFEYFRNGEIVNSIMELGKRTHLPQNKDLTENNWDEHPYAGKVVKELVKRLPTFNLKQVICSALAFDRLNVKNELRIWNMIVKQADRLLHKLKPADMVLFLVLLNKKKERADYDFMNRLLTIMPIHIEHLSDSNIVRIIEVMVQQNMKNDRLLNYFIYPRLEYRIPKFSFTNYVDVLNALADLHYQEDMMFWNDYVLPSIFNFEYTDKSIRSVWNALVKVKINCPEVNISKHILLVENIIKQFENMKESGQDVSEISLKLETDYSLVPKAKNDHLTIKQLKVAQKRLEDSSALNKFMENVNQKTDAESKSKAAFDSLGKVLEVKDWKKARYDMNLEEMQKLKEAKQQAKENRKKKSDEGIKVENVIKEGLKDTNEKIEKSTKTEEKTIDITPTQNPKKEENRQNKNKKSK